MKKLYARWVPRLLTIDNKRGCVTMSKECLMLFERNSNESLRRFVNVNETWIHHKMPETKKQPKQWVFLNGSPISRTSTNRMIRRTSRIYNR